MRALICRRWCAFEELQIEDVPAPPIAPGTVRIEVHYASLSFAINLMVAGKYQHRSPLPFIPGKEVAGVVTEVGPDVADLRVGDRVVSIVEDGGYAEQVIAPAEMVYPVSDGIELRSAIYLPLSYGTAFTALHWRARIAAGETLLVHGAAGGVGLAATQLGRACGARVIATASTEARRAVALENGASLALPSEGFRDAVKAATDGRGADVVFDPVGGSVFDESLRSVGQDGRIVLIGFASGTIPQIPANILLVKNLTVHGFYFGRYTGTGAIDDRKAQAPRVRKMMADLFALCAAGRIAPKVSESFPFPLYRDAMARLSSRESVGKVVLEIRASHQATRS
ncbi:MAG: NADPH:quinone oxidoreductase family protein [Lautropia sp.]